jgi:hypothetical protein
MHAWSSWILSGSTILAMAWITGCGDPAKSDAQAALGNEVSGVRQGPLHRPGQPCLVCHTGDSGDPPEWSIAGTVYLTKNANTPAAGAVVSVTDANKVTKTYKTNAAGNFYEQADRFKPKYPLQSISVTYNDSSKNMNSLVNGSGSCATCHVGDGNARKLPRIYVADQ